MSLQSPPRPTHSQVLGSQQQEDQHHHHPHESKREKQNQEQQNPQHHQQEQQQQLQKIDEEQEHQQEKQYLCQNQRQKPNRPECRQKQPDCPYQEQQQHQEQNQQEQNAHQDQQQQQQQQHPQECKPEQPNSCQYQHEQHALKKQKKEQQEVDLNLRQPKQEQSLCNGKQGEHEHPHQDQQEQHHNPCQQQLASQHEHQIHDHQHPQHPHQFLQYPHHDQHIPQHFHQHQQHPHLHQQQPQHDHHTPQQHHAHWQHPYPYQQHHTKKGLVFMYPEVRGAIAPAVHYLASPPAQLGGTIGSSLGNVQLSQNQQYVQGSVIHESPIPQHIYPAALASHEEVVGDKDLFLTTLSKFHAALGTKLSIPRIGGKDLDLHLLYKEVTARGGLEMVIKDRKWKEITLVFNFPPTTTSASFVLRKYYFYLLHQYEQVYCFQRKGPVVPSPVPLSSVSPASHSLSETECTRSPLEGPVVYKKKQKIDSAQALGVDPASSIGTAVTGCIDGKFDHGYLVNVTVGTRKMRGVLYHVPPSSTVPQHATVSPLMNSLGNELKATVTEHQIQRRRKKKLISRKDPGAPRQNRTGYNFFFAEQRARLKSTQPDKDRAISKMIGDLWNSLSEDEKLPYQERGIQEKERYKKEMCEYKERKRLQAQGVMVGTSSSLSSLQTETKCDHTSDIDLNVVKSVEFKQELIPYQEQVVQPLSESSSVTSSSNHQTLVPGNSDVNAIKNLSSDDGYPVTIDLQDMGKKLFKPDVSNQQKPV